MKRRIRYVLSLLLVCAMVLSLLPVSVLAKEPEDESITVSESAGEPEPAGEPGPVGEPESEEKPALEPEPEPEPKPEPANIIYVKQPGDEPVLIEKDDGNGSEGKPYGSFANAVLQAKDGDTIELLSNVDLKELAYIRAYLKTKKCTKDCYVLY